MPINITMLWLSPVATLPAVDALVLVGAVLPLLAVVPPCAGAVADGEVGVAVAGIVVEAVGAVLDSCVGSAVGAVGSTGVVMSIIR